MACLSLRIVPSSSSRRACVLRNHRRDAQIQCPRPSPRGNPGCAVLYPVGRNIRHSAFSAAYWPEQKYISFCPSFLGAVLRHYPYALCSADRIARNPVQMSVQGSTRLLCFIEQIIFEFLYFSPICIQVSIDFFFIVFAVWLGLDCMTRPIPDAFPSPIFLSVGTIQCLTDAVTSRTLLIC